MHTSSHSTNTTTKIAITKLYNNHKNSITHSINTKKLMLINKNHKIKPIILL